MATYSPNTYLIIQIMFFQIYDNDGDPLGLLQTDTMPDKLEIVEEMSVLAWDVATDSDEEQHDTFWETLIEKLKFHGIEATRIFTEEIYL